MVARNGHFLRNSIPSHPYILCSQGACLNQGGFIPSTQLSHAHEGLILLVLQLPKDKVQGVHLGLEQLYPPDREQVLGRHRYLANLCEPSQSLRIGPVTAV